MSNYEISYHGAFPKVRHKISGELMHSIGSSEDEIETIYVSQSRLREKLMEKAESPLVLWDVGLGAALNASAVICAVNEVSAKRKLILVSFENDLASARLVCENRDLFHSVNAELLDKLLNEKRVETNLFEWVLIEGDFAKTFSSSLHFGLPDICFFDPFSPKTDTEMWSFELLKNLHDAVSKHPFELFTYSQSTAVRASLLAAGFFVAEGKACPPKESSTIACTRSVWRSDTNFCFLGTRWLERWRRSSRQMLENTTPKHEFCSLVEGHELFVHT